MIEFEFTTIMEFVIFGVIAIELYALYNHSKLVSRVNEHILDTDRVLESHSTTLLYVSNNMSKLDEHLIRLDEHMNKLYDHMTRYDEHMTRFDEHINKLDDLLWKSYIQKTENITENQARSSARARATGMVT
jgi:peptidoglycan hydrolase CwlO-like protein